MSHDLKKKNDMTSSAISRARKFSNKHGVELLSEIKESYKINKKNGNLF